MSNPAQEEADLLFSQKGHNTSHPEDRVDAEDCSPPSSEQGDHNNETRVGDEDDDDTLHNIPSASTAKYHLPVTKFDANTGPKGVIADAQSFHRAKKDSMRKALSSITNTLPMKLRPAESGKRKGSDSDSEAGIEEDDEFMQQWRASRLRELSAGNSAYTRRQSPSKRSWGRVDDVDANAYLDAIEKVCDDDIVVVCIYDSESAASREVEDVLSTIAYKYSTTRFVKLHQEIAEMTHVVIPAVIAYRQGDVIATISDCKAEGLESTLRRNGILK